LGFIAQAVVSRSVWSLRCGADLVVLTGAEAGFFPLWSDQESAQFFASRHWPDLEPAELPLKVAIRVHLRALSRASIPVGVGLAPHPEAVVVSAKRLRRDLIAARRAA
jgi:hypothetical protein